MASRFLRTTDPGDELPGFHRSTLPQAPRLLLIRNCGEHRNTLNDYRSRRSSTVVSKEDVNLPETLRVNGRDPVNRSGKATGGGAFKTQSAQASSATYYVDLATPISSCKSGIGEVGRHRVSIAPREGRPELPGFRTQPVCSSYYANRYSSYRDSRFRKYRNRRYPLRRRSGHTAATGHSHCRRSRRRQVRPTWYASRR
jgi:hypothetical protein